jgi:hypothetical protein
MGYACYSPEGGVRVGGLKKKGQAWPRSENLKENAIDSHNILCTQQPGAVKPLTAVLVVQERFQHPGIEA